MHNLEMTADEVEQLRRRMESDVTKDAVCCYWDGCIELAVSWCETDLPTLGIRHAGLYCARHAGITCRGLERRVEDITGRR